jgi:hypothetical protein
MKSLNILKSLLVTEISDKLKKRLLDKFTKEKPDLDTETITFYIDGFERFKNGLAADKRDITKYTFDELEHLVDARQARRDIKKPKKVTIVQDDEDDTNVVYNQDGLVITKGPFKDQCIKYGTGKSWCISRTGEGNLFYNYRFSNNLTIYFSTDKDQPRNSLNAILVILVAPDGSVRCADGSNSGKWGGSTIVEWKEIVQKQPKLEKLQYIFKPEPLTPIERADYDRVRNTRVSNDLYKSFDNNWEDVEKYLEFRSPKLNDEQYRGLLPHLQKKYIALGFGLSSDMISNSNSDVIKYYKKKKMERLEKLPLSSYKEDDIALVNHPSMVEFKEKIKPVLAKDLTAGGKNNEVILKFPDSVPAKFIALYGFDEFFEGVPKDIIKFEFTNNTGNEMAIDIPSTIGEFTNVEQLVLSNCVKSLPESIGNMKSLQFLILSKNPKLVKLPESIGSLPELTFLSLVESPNAEIPKSLADKLTEQTDRMYWIE